MPWQVRFYSYTRILPEKTHTSLIALLVYEYILIWREEWSILWSRKWSGATWLLIASRIALLGCTIEILVPYTEEVRAANPTQKSLFSDRNDADVCIHAQLSN